MRVAIIMDAIESIHYQKDTTLALLWEAAKRQYEIYYFPPQTLYLQNATPYGQASKLDVYHDANK